MPGHSNPLIRLLWPGPPDGQFALVATGSSSVIATVDLTARTTVSTIAHTPNGTPKSIGVAPDGSTAYVTNHTHNPGFFVWVVDFAGRKIVKTLNLGGFPGSMAMIPDGSHVWVRSAATR